MTTEAERVAQFADEVADADRAEIRRLAAGWPNLRRDQRDRLAMLLRRESELPLAEVLRRTSDELAALNQRMREQAQRDWEAA